MSDLVESLIDRHFGLVGGELLVGGVRITSLAGQYGTPCFLYDQTTLEKALDQLTLVLPPRFSVYYSVKANPNLFVLKVFLARGCGLEVASSGEFRRGLDAGCSPARMLFAGPGKTEEELELVISRGIGEIHLESLVELERISAVAARLGLRARVAIRVNPAGEAEGGAMRMGGRPTPFGIDEEQLENVLDRVLGDESLEFRGIHLFTGTQILDADLLLNQYRHGLQIARRLFQSLGVRVPRLDFGGGLGIPYFPHEKALDPERLRVGLDQLFREIEGDPAFSCTEFLLEPGRFLAGEAGIYLARVNDIKVSRGKKFLILDGGMNHHLAASGNLGQTIKRNYPVALVNKLDAKTEETVDVVGPLCTPLDTLARNVALPRAEIGDLFGIFQSGAYGLTASPTGFLSHRLPLELFISNGTVSVSNSLVGPHGDECFLEQQTSVTGNSKNS